MLRPANYQIWLITAVGGNTQSFTLRDITAYMVKRNSVIRSYCNDCRKKKRLFSQRHMSIEMGHDSTVYYERFGECAAHRLEPDTADDSNTCAILTYKPSSRMTNYRLADGSEPAITHKRGSAIESMVREQSTHQLTLRHQRCDTEIDAGLRRDLPSRKIVSAVHSAYQRE